MASYRLGVPGSSFLAEQTFAQVQGTVSGNPTPSAGILTVTTSAAHGLNVGDAVTFAGATATGYNGTMFTVLTVPTSTTFTISAGSTLGQLTGTTINTQYCYVVPPGDFYLTTAANMVLEYNPDNTGIVQNVNPVTGVVTTGATWRTATAVSTTGHFATDGYAVRLRASTANAGNTLLSRVK